METIQKIKLKAGSLRGKQNWKTISQTCQKKKERKIGEDLKKNKIRKEKGEVAADSIEIERIIRYYHE